MIFDGLPSSLRISSARASTSGERASSSKAATSMEIGKAWAATVRPSYSIVLPPGRQVVQPAGELDEVRRRRGPLEADQVRAEQPLDDRRPPGQLGEQLVGREGDVQEEADGQVGPLLAEQRRHQLQLVVVHPDDRVLRRPPPRPARRSAC